MSCGRPNEITPPCQDEDIDPRWLDGSGKPRYALQGINHAELSAQPGAQIRQIPANLLERLHHHAVDKSNTAFARSTMHELAAYLDPKQHNDGGADE